MSVFKPKMFNDRILEVPMIKEKNNGEVITVTQMLGAMAALAIIITAIMDVV